MVATNELEKLSIKLNTAVATVLSISNMIQAELLRVREAGEEVPQNMVPVTEFFVEHPVLPTPPTVYASVPPDETPAPLATPTVKRTRRSHAGVAAAAAASAKEPHKDGRSARWAAHRAQIVADIDAGVRSRPITWTEEDLVKYRAEAVALTTVALSALVADEPSVEVQVPDNGLLSPIGEDAPVVVPAVAESEPEDPNIERIVDQF